MSNEAKKSFTLRRDREDPFRRTVRYYKKDKAGKVEYADGKPVERKKAVQLVFEPGQHIKLTEEEIAFLNTEISTGLLVASNLDSKGRQRDPSQVAPELADAEATIAKLEAKIEQLAGENAKLQEQVKQGADDKKDGSQNDKTPEPGSE